jgi:hypothetical protein
VGRGGRPNILSFYTKRVDWRTPGDAPNDYIPEIYLSEADFFNVSTTKPIRATKDSADISLQENLSIDITS